jgi:hypothetical protein
MDENAMSNIISALIGKNDLGGGSSSWVILLLFIVLMGGGSMWGVNGNRGNVATQSDVFAAQTANSNADAIREVNGNITQLGYAGLQQANAINQNVSQQGFNVQSGVMQGNNALQMSVLGTGNNLQQAINNQGFGIQSAITNQGFGMQKQVADTGNNIMMGMTAGNNAIIAGLNENRFTLAQEECASRATSTANTQKILDKLCDMQSQNQEQRIYDLQVQNQALQLQINNAAQTAQIISAVRPYPQPAYPVSSPYAVYTGGLAIS